MESITVIIETPKGKGLKYDFEPAAGYLKLKKIMPAGLVFPFDFGYIPGTTGGDGDPLDVLVISEIETFPGCGVDCRIIGAMIATQTERNGQSMRNDRFIAIPEVSQQYANIQTLSQLSEQVKSQLEQFFVNYNEQAGKRFKIIERVEASEAAKLIDEGRAHQPLTKLIELFLPVCDQLGNEFPHKHYTAVQKKLEEKFVHVTRYSRVPATVTSDHGKENLPAQAFIVYEIMAADLDSTFWSKYKTTLVKTFGQEDLIIRCTTISVI
jgi:inorganic pyrophosphatase